MGIECENIKQSFRSHRIVTGNMYLFDVQYKQLHTWIAINKLLCNMQITENPLCAFCNEMKTNTTAFMLFDWAVDFGNNVKRC